MPLSFYAESVHGSILFYALAKDVLDSAEKKEPQGNSARGSFISEKISKRLPVFPHSIAAKG